MAKSNNRPAPATNKSPSKPKKSDGRQEYNVTPQQFIEAWQTSNSADEVAEKLQMPKPIVHARASSYRQAGIKLKKHPRHSTKGLDVEGLNALIEQLDGEKAEAQAQAGSSKKAVPPPKGADPETVKAVVEQVMTSLHGKKR